MVVAGLTGSIATGKSTVSEFMREAGAVIIDADRIAHDVVKQGLPAWQEIVAHFGREILQADGEIDRVRLGDIIFRNPDEKAVLNRIVHPHVFQEMAVQLERIQSETPRAVVLLDVPLLIESKMHDNLADVIVVYVPEHIQLERLMRRDGLAEADARFRIESQMPIEEKKGLASIVIDNSGSLDDTRRQTLDAYRRLKEKEGRGL